MEQSIRLDGKTALVTGASSGLGWRFAQVLARAGARVALAARRTDKLEELKREIEQAGGKACAVRMDVTDVASVRAAVAAAESALGGIDILLNNSGVSKQQLSSKKLKPLGSVLRARPAASSRTRARPSVACCSTPTAPSAARTASRPSATPCSMA